jgi:predicted negative regulator of RcsB-dependent stress response
MTDRPDISQLKEIALPAPVSYMPQTWGWLVVLAALVIAVLAFAAWRYWRWRRDRYRREALLRLAELEQAYAANSEALRDLPELLKRVALSMPGDVTAASLGGEQWQRFLQDRSREQLPADFARQLAQLAYAPPAQLQALANARGAALLAQTRRWVETHHVAA